MFRTILRWLGLRREKPKPPEPVQKNSSILRLEQNTARTEEDHQRRPGGQAGR